MREAGRFAGYFSQGCGFSELPVGRGCPAVYLYTVCGAAESVTGKHLEQDESDELLSRATDQSLANMFQSLILVLEILINIIIQFSRSTNSRAISFEYTVVFDYNEVQKLSLAYFQ